MNRKLRRWPDRWPVLILIILWAFFFWRTFTPNHNDAISLKQGDFSGQFVSWTAYSIDRIGNGELPLWNPYMNAGAPFLADPQTAVLYPPRLLTVLTLAATNATSGGSIYFALQTEMTLHVLLALLSMYAFLRLLTKPLVESSMSMVASMVGALTFAFGGYLTSYAPLQLPVLESGVWAPLVLLCIHQATVFKNVRWRWLLGASLCTALALFAGHPQTVLYIAYTSLAYLGYRLWQQRLPWPKMLFVVIIFGGVALALSVAQWLPTAEFQRHTYRTDLTFAAKGGGFDLQELAQFLFAQMLGPWTPLYLGVLGLILGLVAVWRHVVNARFWASVFGIALVLSFGAKLVSYDFVYVFLPGFSLFRDQERSAYVMAIAGSVLISLGTVHILAWDMLTDHKATRQLQRLIWIIIALCGIVSGIFFFKRVTPTGGDFQDELNSAGFALIIAVLSFFVLRTVLRQPKSKQAHIALVALIVFDLFSVTMASPGTYDPVPATERLPKPAYVEVVRANNNADQGQRIEGLVGFQHSYATLYHLPDIWGNSPLLFDSMEFFLRGIPFDRRFELLAVDVVSAEATELPMSNQVVGTGQDFLDKRAFTIFKLDDPRPFAHMVYQTTVVSSVDEARTLIKDLAYPARTRVILEQKIAELPAEEGAYTATIQEFEPESIRIDVTTDTDGVLTLALPYDQGWQISIDGQASELRRAYGGLSAVYMPAGDHTVELHYRPLAVTLGLGLSLLALLGTLIAFGLLKSTAPIESKES